MKKSKIVEHIEKQIEYIGSIEGLEFNRRGTFYEITLRFLVPISFE